MRRVGEELGARYVLEGNLRRVGDALRVTAQLVDADNGAILWTQKFDKPLADLAALQEELVSEVAGQLGVQVVRIEIERALRKPGNLTAWELLLRASSSSLQQTPETIRHGVDLARQAVALAPDYAAAHTQLAMTTSIAFWQLTGGRDAELRKEALEAARRALKLEPDNPSALAGAAQAFCAAGLWRDGISCAERAYQIAPDREATHTAMILVCIYFKRAQEALRHLDACDRLAPRGIAAHVRLIQRAGAHFMLGNYEQAMQATELALLFQPSFIFALKDIVIYLEKMERRAEAIEALAELRQSQPNMTLDDFERLHKGSLLAPDVALDLYETFATVWHAGEAAGALPSTAQ